MVAEYQSQPEPCRCVRGRHLLRRALGDHLAAVFAGFRGPRYHVLGNHDEDSLTKPEFLGDVENTGIPAGRTFYSFDIRGVHFVVLDPNFRADGREFARGDFAWEDCNLPQAELDWLKSDLAAGKGSAVVFIHQQLDGEGAYYVKNAAEVRAALEKSGKVIAVFQGHRHEGGFSLINGIPYFTFRGLVEGAGLWNSAYAIVDVMPDLEVRVLGYRRAETRSFKARVPALPAHGAR